MLTENLFIHCACKRVQIFEIIGHSVHARELLRGFLAAEPAPNTQCIRLQSTAKQLERDRLTAIDSATAAAAADSTPLAAVTATADTVQQQQQQQEDTLLPFHCAVCDCSYDPAPVTPKTSCR
jgi:hypothetical protein